MEEVLLLQKEGFSPDDREQIEENSCFLFFFLLLASKLWDFNRVMVRKVYRRLKIISSRREKEVD